MNTPQETEQAHQKEIETTCEVCGEKKDICKSEALCSQCQWELQQEEQKS